MHSTTTPPPTLGRRFARLSALNILSNLVVPLASLVDTAMLGHLDEIRFLAGVALASVLFEYVYWTFGFLRMATTGKTAQAVGRGAAAEVYRTLYRSLTLAVGLGAAILLLQTGLCELGFLFLTGESGVEAAGRDYFNARIWGAPATLANFAFLGWYLGREASGRALAMTVVGTLVNVAFNYLFIVLWGWAAFGAGLATLISQYTMLVVAVGLFFQIGRPHPWRWREVLDRGGMRGLLLLNRDILVRTFCLVTAFALFTNFSSVLGTLTLAANTILLRVLTLAAYLIDGTAFATESLAGILHGSRNFVGLRRLVRLALSVGVGFALVLLGALLLSPRVLPHGALGLLTSHEEVLALANRFSGWLVPTLCLGAVAYIYDGLFLGLTQGRALRNTMMLSTLGVFCPLAITALSVASNHLLWASLATFMLARAATLHGARRGLTWPSEPG